MPPEILSTEKDFYGDFKFKFGSDAESWVRNVNAVKVNDTAYGSGSVWNNKNYSNALATDGILSLGNQSFTEERNTVVISSKGYDDFSVIVDKDGNIVTGDSEAVEKMMKKKRLTCQRLRARIRDIIPTKSWLPVKRLRTGWKKFPESH
ncbi:DUF1533 domain-containing protein [Clostridium sp. AM45-5]|nr:hemoblobin-interacting domain-containing protein [Clostridium sp. AM45-5]RHS66508.1 DUF1533 domain-containing protein [Clostridium sp. AM45-5]